METREEVPTFPSEFEGEDNREISLHALKGLTNSKIIKVGGKVHNCKLMVLIDSGSTHNFLDEGTTKRMGCKLIDTQPLSVTVANNNKVMSKSACVGFCWEMHGEEFEVDLLLLKPGGCDIVLGVDWMKIVSPISFDFNKMEVTFEKDGRKMTLTGSMETRACKMITGRRLQKMLENKLSQVAQLFSIQATEFLEENREQEGELLVTANISLRTCL